MFRFTTRDVLWLTVVAAVALGWLANWRIQVARYHKVEAEMQEARYYWGTVVADRDRFQSQALNDWQQAELFKQFAHDLQHHAQQNGFDVKIDSGRAVLVRRQADLDQPNGTEPYAPRSSRLRKRTSP